jgi:hypothetical protein
MRKAFVHLTMVVWLLAYALPVMAQTRSAAWLMQRLADQAQENALAADGAHRAQDARTWRAWADRYRGLAALPVAQQADAGWVASSNVAGNRQLAQQARQVGATDAEDLYRASAVFWQDIATQLEHGDALSIHFPERQMLHPVPGLPGTPWERPAGAAPGVAADCSLLAQRVRSCEAQVSGLLNHSLTTGEDNGDFMVVRRAQCDRAQELYVARCASH